MPAADGAARYPAVEMMVATDAVRNLIRKGDDHQLRSQLTDGPRRGHDDDGAVPRRELVRAGRILRETAFAHCFRTDELRRHIDG